MPFLASIVGLFAAQALSAEPVITAGITFEEFKAAFDGEDRVWYAQLQPGSTGDRGTDTHEFEFGGSEGTFSDNEPYYTGDITLVWEETWAPDTSNPFTVTVDAANNLSVTAAGVPTPLNPHPASGYRRPKANSYQLNPHPSFKISNSSFGCPLSLQPSPR